MLLTLLSRNGDIWPFGVRRVQRYSRFRGSRSSFASWADLGASARRARSLLAQRLRHVGDAHGHVSRRCELTREAQLGDEVRVAEVLLLGGVDRSDLVFARQNFDAAQATSRFSGARRGNRNGIAARASEYRFAGIAVATDAERLEENARHVGQFSPRSPIVRISLPYAGKCRCRTTHFGAASGLRGLTRMSLRTARALAL